MAIVTEEKLGDVVAKLYRDIYEAEFRGKNRGRFAITRAQMKQALDVDKLHAKTIARLQDKALEHGLVVIDLDDLFPCVETGVVRQYRRPPKAVFNAVFERTAQEAEMFDVEEED